MTYRICRHEHTVEVWIGCDGEGYVWKPLPRYFHTAEAAIAYIYGARDFGSIAIERRYRITHSLRTRNEKAEIIHEESLGVIKEFYADEEWPVINNINSNDLLLSGIHILSEAEATLILEDPSDNSLYKLSDILNLLGNLIHYCENSKV